MFSCMQVDRHKELAQYKLVEKGTMLQKRRADSILKRQKYFE